MSDDRKIIRDHSDMKGTLLSLENAIENLGSRMENAASVFKDSLEIYSLAFEQAIKAHENAAKHTKNSIPFRLVVLLCVIIVIAFTHDTLLQRGDFGKLLEWLIH